MSTLRSHPFTSSSSSSPSSTDLPDTTSLSLFHSQEKSHAREVVAAWLGIEEEEEEEDNGNGNKNGNDNQSDEVERLANEMRHRPNR
jgi:hypothetical protein